MSTLRQQHPAPARLLAALLTAVLLCLSLLVPGHPCAQADAETDGGESTEVAVSPDDAVDAEGEDASSETEAEADPEVETESKAPRTDAKSRLRKDSKGRVLLAQADASKDGAINTAEAKAEPSLLERIAPGALEKINELLGRKDKDKEEAAAGEDAAPGPKLPPGPGQEGTDAAAGGERPLSGQPGFVPDKPGGGAPPADGGRGGFSEEDLQKLLPGFAQDQPGSIGEAPGQVVAQPPGPASPVEPFESLLGDSMLPEGSSEEEIAKDAQDPSRGVAQNFARVVIPTGKISGSTETKQFHIEGGLQIYYNKVVISADTADIDEHNEVAHLYGNVSIDDPQYTLSTDDLLINFKEKRFQASGFVQFQKNAKAGSSQPDFSQDKKNRVRNYFAGQQFELFCKTLFYNWESKELSAIDSVRLVHPSFNGTLDRLDYNDKTKVYAMSGTVVLEVTNYEWIFVNKLVEGEDEKKARALTDAPTKINADLVLYSEESGLAQFYAQPGKTVEFLQAKRNIKGTYIEVNDKTKDFYVEGDSNQRAVFSQQDGDWLIQGGLIKEGQVSEDLKTALLKPLTAEAGSITYNFDRKRMELRDGVKIVSEQQSVEAGEVIQDETAKFFLMRQNVVIKPDAEGYIYAAQIYMDTENDVFTFVGLVNGKVKSDDIPDLTPQAEDVNAGADLGGAGRQTGPAQGLFQNTGGVTFSGSNRTTSAAQEKRRLLEEEEARRAAQQREAARRDAAQVDDIAQLASRSGLLDKDDAIAALNGEEEEAAAAAAAKPDKKAAAARPTARSRAEEEAERKAERLRNGDTNVADRES
ncbi:hypothetical protein IT575_11075 [bacterium]|nr:hypothetical protein [bacterium]